MPRHIPSFQLDRVVSLPTTVFSPFIIIQWGAALAIRPGVEARKARVAKDLLERLCRMGDVDLTGIGMARGDVAARLARQLSSCTGPPQTEI